MEVPEAKANRKMLSLRTNLLWAFAGNATASLCTWVLLMLLTKMASAQVVGVYAVAQAVALPIWMLLSLKLPLAQVTDARNEFDFGHYYALSLIMAILIPLVTFTVAFCSYPVHIAVITTLVGAGYALMILCDIFLAVMQKAERMDKMAASRIIQGVLSVLLFGGLFLATRNLVSSIVGLITARLLVLYFYNMPVGKKLLHERAPLSGGSSRVCSPHWHTDKLVKLTRKAIPLGITAWLGTLFTSIPRLALARFWSTEHVGYFAALSSLLVALNIGMGALSQSTSPRLAKYYFTNRSSYKRLLAKVTGVALVLGLTAIAASVLCGKAILTILFTREYAQHDSVFIQTMVAGAILLLFASMNCGLTATRRFTVQVPVYTLSAVACAISAILLIPRYGMMGAAWSLTICYTVGFSGCLLLVCHTVHRRTDIPHTEAK
jgi:O-antigen/teichoic acid export membrane protein